LVFNSLHSWNSHIGTGGGCFGDGHPIRSAFNWLAEDRIRDRSSLGHTWWLVKDIRACTWFQWLFTLINYTGFLCYCWLLVLVSI
jgi:hypothetical protein